MKKVEPKVFLIGESAVVEDGLREYLNYLDVPDWKSDAPTDEEKIVEVMGRLCYRSFKPGLNPNVTKVREHNKDYIENILKVKHGSVIEHPVFNFIFADVSRIFTHELVRHRVGVAISQESLRFVRIEELRQWLPAFVREDGVVEEIFVRAFKYLEKLQKTLAKHWKLDDVDLPFHKKKKITSAMRRLAPEGLATTVGWSANPRTLRWVIEARTDPGAEEEIRLVFGMVAEIVIKRYPHLFGDFTKEIVDGLPFYQPVNSKI